MKHTWERDRERWLLRQLHENGRWGFRAGKERGMCWLSSKLTITSNFMSRWLHSRPPIPSATGLCYMIKDGQSGGPGSANSTQCDSAAACACQPSRKNAPHIATQRDFYRNIRNKDFYIKYPFCSDTTFFIYKHFMSKLRTVCELNLLSLSLISLSFSLDHL